VVGGDLAHRLETVAAEAAAALRRLDAPRDWLDEVLDLGGDALKSDEAAFVAGCHVDTLLGRCKIAAATDRPLGTLMAGAIWLISKRRLLAAIEAKEGLPARLAAESRAQKSVESRLPPEKSIRNRVMTGV
jgi:hypothetical protein